MRKSIKEFMGDGQNIPTPTTDEEHIIHALNIQGTFFERKCQNTVHQVKAWEIQDTNYPVTYGGANSNLDIWVLRGKNTYQHLVLHRECKKNNPDFINWIFFRQPSHRPDFSHMQMIGIQRQSDGSNTREVSRKLQRFHDVDLSTGVIALDKPKLVPCPYLIFDYPVPPALQLIPKALHMDYIRDTLKQLARMPIFIVHSEAFPTFLERLSTPTLHPPAFEGDDSWYELYLKPEESEETKE